MTQWILLAVSVVLIAACGVFVAGEFSLLAADRATVEREAAQGDRAAAGVLTAFRTLSTQLSGVQVAITLTNLAIGFLAEPSIAGLLRGPFDGLGEGTAETLAVIVGLVLSTLLTMLFGELVPKNLAIAAPLAVAKAVQGPVRLFTRLASWPIRALNWLADRVLALFGLEAQEELASARSPDEIVALVRRSAHEGTLADRTAVLVTRTITFGERRAGEVMTPRTAMTTVDHSASVADLLAVVGASGLSRLPVLGPGGLDEVVGVVELDDAVTVPAERRSSTPVDSVMSPAVEVPEALPLDQVLRTLQRDHARLAIVVDEYGGTAGLLTGEDLLEELVGEVDDEHDRPAPVAVRAGDGWEVSGRLRPDEVAAATGLRLPDQGPFDTLGGLMMHRLGRIPAAGDEVDVDGVRLQVAAMDGRRIDRVHASATMAQQ